ncbi:50S ribosomal protein L21 protein [Thalictrum thalictroides]|uniref:Large ribosomal subunit protein bL21m n=1 Tax=Thalictrum thalictroides TaxID=46969 RepID=A0A7J6VWH7_THATH|nr:50S ribosomal protein L21 protein [Thalictrum thalictroides]
MATRRCFKTLPRHYPSFFSSNPPFKNLNTTVCAFYSTQSLNFENPISNLNQNHHFNLISIYCNQFNSLRHFSSQRRNRGNRDEEYDEDELSECSEGEEDVDDPRSKAVIKRTYTVEEKEEEAAAIGYKVIGPLDPKEEPFKNREPYFAVIQIGSHQFKVSNGDYIYTEKLKFCEVNDKVVTHEYGTEICFNSGKQGEIRYARISA